MENTPAKIKGKDISRYEPTDIRHYLDEEVIFFRTRQYLRGIDEHREISSEEIDKEIVEHLERDFRKWYFNKFPNKIIKKRNQDY